MASAPSKYSPPNSNSSLRLEGEPIRVEEALGEGGSQTTSVTLRNSACYMPRRLAAGVLSCKLLQKRVSGVGSSSSMHASSCGPPVDTYLFGVLLQDRFNIHVFHITVIIVALGFRSFFFLCCFLALFSSYTSLLLDHFRFLIFLNHDFGNGTSRQ